MFLPPPARSQYSILVRVLVGVRQPRGQPPHYTVPEGGGGGVTCPKSPHRRKIVPPVTMELQRNGPVWILAHGGGGSFGTIPPGGWGDLPAFWGGCPWGRRGGGLLREMHVLGGSPQSIQSFANAPWCSHDLWICHASLSLIRSRYATLPAQVPATLGMCPPQQCPLCEPRAIFCGVTLLESNRTKGIQQVLTW